jgi:Putative NADP-dependent oxidoreductases
MVFDNVGGEVLEAALDSRALHARVVLCGSISSGYCATGYGAGPHNYMQLPSAGARMEGFIFLTSTSSAKPSQRSPAGWPKAASSAGRTSLTVWRTPSPHCKASSTARTSASASCASGMRHRADVGAAGRARIFRPFLRFTRAPARSASTRHARCACIPRSRGCYSRHARGYSRVLSWRR